MTKSILIQKCSSNGVSSKLHDVYSFQGLIKTTEIYLLKLKQRLIEARIDNNLGMPYCPSLQVRLDKDVVCGIFVGPFDQHISTISLESIEAILLHNNAIASLLSNGIDESSALLVHGKHIYIGKEKENFDGIISKYSLIKPNTCPKCLYSITEEAIDDHSKSVMCMDRVIHNMIEAKQLTQVGSDVEEQLIRTTGIPYEHHPVQYGVYVPKWVDTAIKAYDSMRNRGGFQDMTLAEYLNHMAQPEQ